MFKFSTEGMANELERQRHGKQKGQKTCNLVISLKPFLSNQNVNVANAFLFENTSSFVSDTNLWPNHSRWISSKKLLPWYRLTPKETIFLTQGKKNTFKLMSIH